MTRLPILAAKRWVIVSVAACLTLAACGARVDPLLESGGGGNASANTNDTVAPNNAGGSTETTLAAASAGGGGGTGGQSATATTTKAGAGGAPSGGFKYDAASEAAACTGTAGNTASDVGVTPTEIKLGNVSGLTGVITNSFNQGPEGVQALFADINAHGGICGRKLSLITEDDGQDPGRNEANTRDLIPKVLAFVGSASDADNAGVAAMVDAKVPDVGFAINANRGQSAVFWSAAGSTLYTQNGKPYSWSTLEDGLKEYHSMPKRIAALAYSIPISADAAQQFAYRFKQAGAEICYTNYSINPANPSFDSDVISMKRNNCDGVFTTIDLSGNAKLLQSEQRQGFKPLTFVTFESYTPDQISVAGQEAAQGLQMTINWTPFNEPQPVKDIYLQQLKTYQPGKQPSSFGYLSWASAQMFVQALIHGGRNPTRASLASYFATLENYDTGGSVTPVTPRLRRPVGPCVVQVAVKGNDFVRVWPPSGFYCKANLVQSAP